MKLQLEMLLSVFVGLTISNVDEKSKLRCYKQFRNGVEFEKYLLFLISN